MSTAGDEGLGTVEHVVQRPGDEFGGHLNHAASQTLSDVVAKLSDSVFSIFGRRMGEAGMNTQ
ncbi:MAG: hypothetical protein WBO08_15720 [Mycobacterium sp.]|nr:hypothetical protein [Mycobacterium sp.]